MKGKNRWSCFLMILAGIVIGGLIGTLCPNTWLNYGQTFGLTSPFLLDLGIMTVTFAMTIKITVSSIIGIIIGIIIYRFL